MTYDCTYCRDVGGAIPFTDCPVCGRTSDALGDPDLHLCPEHGGQGPVADCVRCRGLVTGSVR